MPAPTIISLDEIANQSALNQPPISTSERSTFRRCLRKWWLSYCARIDLVPDGVNDALWFGTGYHYALADAEGFNIHGSPKRAFDAYLEACQKTTYIPSDADRYQQLAHGMLDYYYSSWLPRRNEYNTLQINGIPQVEVRFKAHFPKRGYTYHGRFDRVVVDLFGRYFIEEIKTAAQFDTRKLPNDPQASAYTAIASLIYGFDFDGMIYTQHKKSVPEMPRELKSGALSQDRTQPTTHAMYRAALIAKYDRIPTEYIEFLNSLAQRETDEGDQFVRRDKVYRNRIQQQNELRWIGQESYDMQRLRERGHIAAYPNNTRDCGWECQYTDLCAAMDDGTDWLALINESGIYQRRKEADDRSGWQQALYQLEQSLITPSGQTVWEAHEVEVTIE